MTIKTTLGKGVEERTCVTCAASVTNTFPSHMSADNARDLQYTDPELAGRLGIIFNELNHETTCEESNYE